MKPRKSSRLHGIRFFQVGILAGLFVVIVGGVAMASIIRSLPDPATFNNRVVNQSTKIYDRTGQVLLYEIHGNERRTILPFDQIPQSVKWATLAAEDTDFYHHPAFDIKAIGRAVLHDIFSRNGTLQGGSTITQQLVKNSLLEPERSLTRKIKELILAVKLEQYYTKDQIFGFYLNQIPYGSNAYGIEAASQTFFAKPAKDLTLEEAALLTALLNAPTYYSPYGSHTNELKQRQGYVLDRMAEAHFITKEEADAAKKKPLSFAPQSYGIRAPHFVFFVREQLEGQYGVDVVENGGLKVITTLDWNAQQIAEKAVEEGALANVQNWHADNAALVAENAKTGEILAMVGSHDYFDLAHQGNVNAATSVRQPGSSFKPFVYVTALKKGYTPDTILFDVPTEFVPNNPKCPAIVDFSNTSLECYHPKNYDEKFRGPVTVRQALAQSLNVPSVKFLYVAGVSDSIQTAQGFGITTLTEPASHYGLSLVLGGGGVKLTEMVNAYSVFSQEGMFHPQTSILEVDDSNGQALEKAAFDQKRVIDPQYARLINNILSDDQARVPAFQPNGSLTLPDRKVAAKTGTSEDYRDAWTIGYTPSVVAGVWVGNNDNSPMVKGGAGVMAAAPIWHAFMAGYLNGTSTPPESFTSPDPVEESKPILRGQYIVDLGNGPQVHDTLYWIDKNNPQGPIPAHPESDPQFANWEASVRGWLQGHSPNWQSLSELRPSPTSIELLEPQPGQTITDDGLRITARVHAPRALTEVDLLFNQQPVIVFPPSPDNTYSVYFVPQNWQPKNDITIEAKSDAGIVAEASFSVAH